MIDPIQNTNLDYVKQMVDFTNENRDKISVLISKLGKYDSRYINKEAKTAHKSYEEELLYEVVTPVVLVEKIGNANKGIVTGLHVDYGDIPLQRLKYKEDKNVFNMWVKGEISGSLVVIAEAGFLKNALTNETFFGCSYPWIKTKEDLEKFKKKF